MVACEPWSVAPCRCLSSPVGAPISVVSLCAGVSGGNSCRDRSRLGASCRTGQFFNLRDVAGNRFRSDHVPRAEGRFLPEAVEITFHAIALDAAECAWVARVFVTDEGVLDCDGVLVAVCRDRSWCSGPSNICPEYSASGTALCVYPHHAEGSRRAYRAHPADSRKGPRETERVGTCELIVSEAVMRH